jgi:hypothetical protein
MAIVGSRITASATPVALNSKSFAALRMTITNTGANGADLGAANVTAGNGYALPAGASVQLRLNSGDQVYAIRSSTADAVLSVLLS